MKDPNRAYEQITNLNDILAFADDTLIFSEDIFDIKRAIEGLTVEIKRMGLEINPAKCCLLINGDVKDEERVLNTKLNWEKGVWEDTPADFNTKFQVTVKNTKKDLQVFGKIKGCKIKIEL